MLHRMLIAVVVVLAASDLALAGQPGEKARGPEFKNDSFVLVWGKMRTSGDVDLGDPSKSKYTLQLEGSMESPTDLDVVAVQKRFRIASVVDDKEAEMGGRATTGYSVSAADAYSAIHDQVGQVELPRTDLLRDASKIRTMTVESEIIIAAKRVEVTLPAVVMEDFKDVGQGVSIRITSLQMSAGRDLSVTMSYKRPAAGANGAFIEKVFAADPGGRDIGGGRWTSGNPFSTAGTFTGKFKVDTSLRHQSFRIELVTECEIRKVSFPMTMNGLEMVPTGESVAANPPEETPAESTDTLPAPDPLADYLARQEGKKAVTGLLTANYKEVDGLPGLWLSPMEQNESAGRQVQAVGKLRYIGEEDLSDQDLTLQITYRNRAGRLVGLSEFQISGQALKPDRDYTFRQPTPLSEEYSVLQAVTVKFIKKAKAVAPRTR